MQQLHHRRQIKMLHRSLLLRRASTATSYRFTHRYLVNTTIRASSTGAASTQSNDTTNLLDWVTSSGGKVQGVAIHKWLGADGGSGYGLRTSTKISAGTPLITLPPSCLLTYNTTSTDPRLLKLIEKVPGELWGSKLALALLAERVKGDESNFNAYIQMLPQGFSGLPIFFDAASVQALEYPPVKQQITLRCRWLIEFASKVLAPLQNNNNAQNSKEDPFDGTAIDANALGWALGAVTSRAFRIGGASSSRPAALLPLIDMANHSFQPNAKIVPVSGGPANGGLAMVALNDIEQDEPVLLSYGELPNDFFLLDYGFLVVENPYDYVQLGFSLELVEAAKAVAGLNTSTSTSSTDNNSETLSAPKLAPYQLDYLNKLNLTAPKTEVSLTQLNNPNHPGCPVEPKLLAGVRVLCTTAASQLQKNMPVKKLGEWDYMISPGHELATMKTLSGLALIALSQFSCGVEKDEELLRQGGSSNKSEGESGAVLSDDQKLAVRFRAEKKRLLLAALNAFSERIKEVSGGGGGGGKKDDDEKKKKGVKSNSGGKGFGN